MSKLVQWKSKLFLNVLTVQRSVTHQQLSSVTCNTAESLRSFLYRFLAVSLEQWARFRVHCCANWRWKTSIWGNTGRSLLYSTVQTIPYYNVSLSFYSSLFYKKFGSTSLWAIWNKVLFVQAWGRCRKTKSISMDILSKFVYLSETEMSWYWPNGF